MGTYIKSVTRTADAAIATRRLLVKQGSTAAHIALNTDGDEPLGLLTDEVALGERVGVELLGATDETREMIASGVIPAGNNVLTDDGGKVQDEDEATAGTYFRVGKARTAAAADDDVIEVEPCLPVRVVVNAALTSAAAGALTGAAPAAAAALTTDLTGVDTGTDMTAAQAAQVEADLAALKAGIDANNASIDQVLADNVALRTALNKVIADVAALGAALVSPSLVKIPAA